MSLRNFMISQRKKFVGLIYESISDRCQRYSQILKFVEELQKKNQLQPEDDTVYDSLLHLKSLLQFTNSDTAAQIDLALEQSSMAGHYSISKMPPPLIVLEEDTKPPLLSNLVPEIDLSFQQQMLASYQNRVQEINLQPISNIPTQSLKSNSSYSSEQSTVQIFKNASPTEELPNQPIKNIKSNIHPSNIISTKRQIISKNQEKKDPVIQGSTLLYMMDDTKIKNTCSRNQCRNRSIITKSSFVINDKQEQKFKDYIKGLTEFEESHNLVATPKFQDKHFFFLRSQNSTLPVMSVLNEDDFDFIFKVSEFFPTQKAVSDLLSLRAPLVSSVIAKRKERKHRRSRKVKQDSDEEENYDDDEEEDEIESGVTSFQIENDEKEQQLQPKKQEKKKAQSSKDEGIGKELQRITQGWSKETVEEPFEVEENEIASSFSMLS